MSNILTLLHISFAAEAQQTQRNVLLENEVWVMLKPLKLQTGNLRPRDSKSEGQVMKEL
jgi:hypothetical protein